MVSNGVPIVASVVFNPEVMLSTSTSTLAALTDNLKSAVRAWLTSSSIDCFWIEKPSAWVWMVYFPGVICSNA